MTIIITINQRCNSCGASRNLDPKSLFANGVLDGSAALKGGWRRVDEEVPAWKHLALDICPECIQNVFKKND